MIERAIPLVSRVHNGFVPQFQRYHLQHLISGSLSTMRELISLQVYSMTIATDQYSKRMSQDWINNPLGNELASCTLPLDPRHQPARPDMVNTTGIHTYPP